jgi:hypothetical protein
VNGRHRWNRLGCWLDRRWLPLARASWGALALLSIVFVVTGLPERHAELTTHWFTVHPIPPEVVREGLAGIGVSPGVYAGFGVAIYVLRAAVCYIVGALLFWRKSREPMALLVAIFLVTLPGGDTDPRDLHELFATDPLRATAGIVPEVVAFTLVFWLFLLFPNGRFSPGWARWAALAWLIAGAGTLLLPGSPIDMSSWPTFLSLTFVPALVTLGIGIQVWRYHRVSGSLERQQTKWFALGFTIVLVEFAAGALATDYAGFRWPEASPSQTIVADVILHTVHNLAFLALPLSLAVAVLRHRLWDLDHLISRAMLYGSLTAILAGVYLGGVLALERLFRAAAGQGSNLAIVATTLAVAALIQPLRRRLQAAVDRRFSRRRYDAANTLAAFGAAVRDETDPARIRAGLLRAVDDAMQPAHATLWLRGPDRGGSPR